MSRYGGSELRRYGYFKCTKAGCRGSWESSHVYVDKVKQKALYSQDCKQCKKATFPYRIERITCARCGLQECVCTKEEKAARHIDKNKPHLAALCGRCRAGKRCQGNTPEYDVDDLAASFYDLDFD